MAKTKVVSHVGRAANCSCKDEPGDRCPDCNHLLSSDKCVVCGRQIRSEHSRDIQLIVNNATQESGAKIE